MQAGNEPYGEKIKKIEEDLLRFLRLFESFQEKIHFARLAEQKEELKEAVGELFSRLKADLSALSPPDPLRAFHSRFSQALGHLEDAYTLLLKRLDPPSDPGQVFLSSRGRFCQGLYLLYEIRSELSALPSYWVFPEALPSLKTLEARTPGLEVPVGLIHKGSNDRHAPYSLYIPENYSPEQKWPLIVCLHGGYGRGEEYIWTWLRPAKSKGYLLLAPKSMGPTWSALNPPVDIRSIRAILEEVLAVYEVDRRRIYLTGLSDGGIFTYVLGLSCPELFAGLAPVAGQLHAAVDRAIRQGRGKEVPILVVHGAHDFIFPVRFTQQTCELLRRLGYQVTYEDLSDWGHAYPYSINERIVLPWFERVGAKLAS